MHEETKVYEDLDLQVGVRQDNCRSLECHEIPRHDETVHKGVLGGDTSRVQIIQGCNKDVVFTEFLKLHPFHW